MPEQNHDDEQKTAAASKTTQPAAKPAAKQPQGTGEEPTPGGVHRPGRTPGEYVDSGPVTMPVRQK